MDKSPQQKNLTVFINSLMLFLLSWLLLLLATQFFTKLVAEKIFDIPTNYEHLKLIFTIGDSSPLWTRTSIIGVYIVSPFLALGIAISSLIYLLKAGLRNRNLFKLFVLWTYLHSVNLIFGGMVLGVPLMKGVGYVPAWLGFPEALLYVFAGLSLILLGMNGFLVDAFFASFGYSSMQYTQSKSQLKFKFIIAILPALVLALVYNLVGISGTALYDRGLWLTFLIQLIGILYYKCLPVRPRKENPVNQRINLFVGASLLLLLIIAVIL